MNNKIVTTKIKRKTKNYHETKKEKKTKQNFKYIEKQK